MAYNKPSIPKGTRFFYGVFVPYLTDLQRINKIKNRPTRALKNVKFAENTRI
jgi:hypothetical protein